MTLPAFVTLLTIFATVTGLVVEGVKKILDDLAVKYSTNIVACITGAIVGIGGTALYYLIAAIPYSAVNIALMVVMGLASALGAMIGYDKIIQAINQLKK